MSSHLCPETEFFVLVFILEGLVVKFDCDQVEFQSLFFHTWGDYFSQEASEFDQQTIEMIQRQDEFEFFWG